MSIKNRCLFATNVFIILTLISPIFATDLPATITIQNTSPRLDIQGNVIDAHDGCLEFFDGKFYLFGTRYGNTDGFTQANRYVCYSSQDLVKWQFHGEILQNPPQGVYYRPYVKYNRKTKMYVLWYNWYPTLWDGQYGVAVSSSPAGPFVIQNDNVKVKHEKPGDHGLFIDDNSNAYLIYTSIANDHGISIEKLSDDYLSSTLDSSGIFAKECEAVSMFKNNGIYYAVFDKCCCFCPEGTGAMVYTAKSPLGPYKLQGNINRNDSNQVIIAAQQTHIATIPALNGPIYIWMADRWGSRPDGIKGHDLQYWSGPLQFLSDGTIKKLNWQDSWTLELPANHDENNQR
ncbi:MAG TPA: family 43 glycosylhydrolase [Sedimentisphaerales bacterium]|nr:family 43 glycosylhydrolase [Sedimentisphaerales bacterium]